MNPDGSADVNLVSLYDRDSGTPEEPKVYMFDELIAGPEHTAALKITSQAHDIHVFVKRGRGGNENWLDVNNRAQRIRVFCDDLEAPGKYAATIKGGSKDVTLTAHLTGLSPKVCHVNGGDYSDQCKDVTEGIELALTCAGPQPVTWRSLNATGWLFAKNTGPYKCKFQVPLGGFGRWLLMFGWDIAKRLNWN